MKKGFAGIKIIVSAILVLIFIAAIVPIALNKNFFEDTLDSINNFFQPPEIDPAETHRQVFLMRQEALQLFEEWAQAYNKAIESQETTCYEDIPNIPKEIAEAGYEIIIASNTKDELYMQLQNKGFPISKPHKINTGFCMIIDKEETMLKRARENLILRYNPQACTLTEPCYNFFLQDTGIYKLNPNPGLSEDATPEDIMRDLVQITGGVTLKVPDLTQTKTKENSMKLLFTKITNNQPETIIDTSTTQLSEDQAFRLMKINNQICILPIDESRKIDTNLLKRNEFYYLTEYATIPKKSFSFTQTDYKGLLPKCQKTRAELLDYMTSPIIIVFSTTRAIASDTHFPQKITYKEGKWESDFALESHRNPAVGPKILSSTLISSYIMQVLENKNYEQGILELCDMFVFGQEKTITGKTEQGTDTTAKYEITSIQGLRCELVLRTAAQQVPNTPDIGR